MVARVLRMIRDNMKRPVSIVHVGISEFLNNHDCYERYFIN